MKELLALLALVMVLRQKSGNSGNVTVVVNASKDSDEPSVMNTVGERRFDNVAERLMTPSPLHNNFVPQGGSILTNTGVADVVIPEKRTLADDKVVTPPTTIKDKIFTAIVNHDKVSLPATPVQVTDPPLIPPTVDDRLKEPTYSGDPGGDDGGGVEVATPEEYRKESVDPADISFRVVKYGTDMAGSYNQFTADGNANDAFLESNPLKSRITIKEVWVASEEGDWSTYDPSRLPVLVYVGGSVRNNAYLPDINVTVDPGQTIGLGVDGTYLTERNKPWPELFVILITDQGEITADVSDNPDLVSKPEPEPEPVTDSVMDTVMDTSHCPVCQCHACDCPQCPECPSLQEPPPEVLDEPPPEVLDEPPPEVLDEPPPEVLDEPPPAPDPEPEPPPQDQPNTIAGKGDYVGQWDGWGPDGNKVDLMMQLGVAERDMVIRAVNVTNPQGYWSSVNSAAYSAQLYVNGQPKFSRYEVAKVTVKKGDTLAAAISGASVGGSIATPISVALLTSIGQLAYNIE